MIKSLLTRNSKKLINNNSIALARSLSVDVHTHMYTPRYMDILRKRTTIPRVITIDNNDRLVILPGEDKEITTSTGRPIGREYYDVNAKIQFMDTHNITTSIVSLANPWLDFLYGNEASSVAEELNDELQAMCEQSHGRLYGFATLPIRNPEACIKEIARIKSLDKIRGVILGTPGAGKGLDHENIRDVLAAIADADLMVFLHPHYGVGNEHYHDTGHALFLALGFPFETTVAVSRLIVSGALDQIPHLKLLVAHAGAALPSLIGRLDSCVAHDNAIANRLLHEPSTYFKRMYFDAVSYSTPALECLIQQVGVERLMFGTDNPFFPPLGVDLEDEEGMKAVWPSTEKVYRTINAVSGEDAAKKILTDNATRVLHLK